ncbi:hypothetical protein [Piscinibacter sp.]|uniref:hypothetical protein n=1 Tax=Piscinibacter sp. TaxID=1903157 RepID=UPI0039E222C9
MRLPFLAFAALALSFDAAAAVEPPPSPAFAQALDAVRSGRHAAAYGRFAALADAGHAPSAQIALLMLRHGEAMFGSAWSATTAQQQRWNALAVNTARRRLDALDNPHGD